jgi:hypothetical protein
MKINNDPYTREVLPTCALSQYHYQSPKDLSVSTHVNDAYLNNFRMVWHSISTWISATSPSRIFQEYPGFHNAAHQFLLYSSLFPWVASAVPEHCNNSRSVTQNASSFMMATVKNPKPYLMYILYLFIHHSFLCRKYKSCMMSLRIYPNNFFRSLKFVTIMYNT